MLQTSNSDVCLFEMKCLGWIVQGHMKGYVEFKLPSANGCKILKGGNPPLVLNDNAISSYGQNITAIIDLPDQTNFEYINPTSALTWGQYWLGM